jgi:hypothetical protein
VKRIEFDEACRIKKGTAVGVRLHGRGTYLADFNGILPGKPNAKSFRERQDAIVVRQGDIVSYYRRNEVCDIEVDGRHLTRGTTA